MAIFVYVYRYPFVFFQAMLYIFHPSSFSRCQQLSVLVWRKAKQLGGNSVQLASLSWVRPMRPPPIQCPQLLPNLMSQLQIVYRSKLLDDLSCLADFIVGLFCSSRILARLIDTFFLFLPLTNLVQRLVNLNHMCSVIILEALRLYCTLFIF